MEKKERLVLKHKSGMYWSEMAALTPNLFLAKRFMNQETAELWLQTSIYAPDRPEEYTLIPVIQTIEEV